MAINGTKLYVLGIDGDDINEYDLSTPYDISTGSFNQIALDVSGQESVPTSMLFGGAAGGGFIPRITSII